MASLYGISIKLSADLKNFSSNLQNAERDLTRFGKNMQSIGSQLSVGLTAPLVAFAALSVKAFDTQAQAVNKLSVQIAQNGKDVEKTLSDYKTFASELQNVTTVGDETTLQLLQMAETMQSSAPKEAARGAIALSKALGLDMQAAIKASTLAIEGDYNMLKRYVPALKATSDQGEQAAIVQKLFADGLEIAKKEAETGLGPIIQLQNAWGDFMEKMGEIVGVAIIPLVNRLKGLVDYLNSMDRGTRAIVITLGAMAAGIGPIIYLVGTTSRVISGLVGAFRNVRIAALSAANGMNVAKIAMASIPIIAVVAGLVAIGTAVYSASTAYDEAAENANKFNAAVDTNAPKVLDLISTRLEIIGGQAQRVAATSEQFAESLKTLDVSTLERISTLLEQRLLDANREFNNALDDTAKKAANLKKTNIENQLAAIASEIDKGKTALTGNNDELKESIALLPKVAQLTREAFPQRALSIDTGTIAAPALNNDSFLKGAELVANYSREMENLTKYFSLFGDESTLIEQQIQSTQTAISDLIDSGYGPLSDEVKVLIGNLDILLQKKKELNDADVSADENQQKQAKNLQLLTSVASEFGNALVDAAFSGANVMESLKNTLIAVAKQIIKTYMAMAIGIAIEKAMEKGGNPLIGLILAGIAVAGVVAMYATKVPKLAGGGMAFKPTYAMIGDNVGASSDPEVVAPLSKLKEYIGGNNGLGGRVEFVLRGENLYGSLQNYERKRGRVR